MHTAVAVAFAFGMAVANSAFATDSQQPKPPRGLEPQPRIIPNHQREATQIDSRIQLLLDEVQALQAEKACLNAARSYNDSNACRVKEDQAMGQARLRLAERQKAIDSQKDR